jgi:ABC-2 type transport system permease protein
MARWVSPREPDDPGAGAAILPGSLLPDPSFVPTLQTLADLYRHRFILSNLVGKNFKAMYRNMALGFLWSFLNPLVLVTVLSIVWTLFFHAEEAFASKVMVALIPYNFFVYSLSGCSSSIIGNASLVKKVAFPRQILPVSVILTHLAHFGIQSLLIVGVLLVFGAEPGASILAPRLLWLPLILCVQVGLCVGAGLLVAGLNVVYRDVQYLVDSLMTILFWVSPILYEAGPEFRAEHGPVALLFFLNPLSGILEAYRSVLYRGQAPDLVTFGIAVVITALVGWIGVRSFWIHEKQFADLI